MITGLKKGRKIPNPPTHYSLFAGEASIARKHIHLSLNYEPRVSCPEEIKFYSHNEGLNLSCTVLSNPPIPDRNMTWIMPGRIHVQFVPIAEIMNLLSPSDALYHPDDMLSIAIHNRDDV